MAGSGSRKSEKQLKNIDMLTVRNVTKQEVTNVIFPNGITVGMNGAKFKNGLRIHGNAQVSGVVNAQGFKVNGEDLTVSGQPFLFLDVNSNAVSFDNSSDPAPSPSSIDITVTQQGQATTLQASDITAIAPGPTSLTVSSFSVTETSVGNSTATATIDVSSLGRSGFPVVITVSNDGLSSSKSVLSVTGGDAGAAAPTIIPLKFTFDYSSATPKSNPMVHLPEHGVGSLTEGFVLHDQTFGGGQAVLGEVTPVTNIDETINAPTGGSALHTLWWPELAGSDGKITNITGAVIQDSNITASSSFFNIILYETNTSLSTTNPTKFDHKHTLDLDGSDTAQNWAASTSYLVSLTNPITISDGFGLTFGIRSVGSSSPVAGKIVVSLLITYTGQYG